MSWLRSLARSGERKQDSEDRVRPASYLQTITIICTISSHSYGFLHLRRAQVLPDHVCGKHEHLKRPLTKNTIWGKKQNKRQTIGFGQLQHLCVLVEALAGSKITNSLLCELCAAHHLDNKMHICYLDNRSKIKLVAGLRPDANHHLFLNLTSIILNPAQLISYPNIWR